MTLLEIQLTIQQIFQLLGKPLETSLEQYNNYLRMAQDELFKEFAHGYMSGNGAEVDSRAEAFLSPFKHFDTAITLGGSGTLFSVSGVIYTLPANTYCVLSAQVSNDTLAYPNKVIKIDILLANEVAERLQNAITYPTSLYPIAVIDISTLRLCYLPQQYPPPYNIDVISLYKPTTPVLVETITNGVRTQNASSVPLQIDSMFHVDVIRKILQYLGVSIGNEFISAVVEQQKNLEK